MVKILVQGASGNTGCAIVQALITKNANVVAGVRDTNKQIRGNAQAVKFDTGNVDEAVKALNGIDVLVVCPPGGTPSWEDRYRFAAAMGTIISRARQQNLKHVVMITIPGASSEATLFARQFYAIERVIAATGVGYTFLALQMFTDNFLAWAQGIKQGTLQMQLSGKGKKAFAPLTLTDIGEATANVALNYSAHNGKNYLLSGPQQFSADEIATEFARILGTPVEHVAIDADASKRAFCRLGFPEWQAEGMTELFSMAENRGDMLKPTPQLEQLLGRAPTTLSQWIRDHKTAFVGGQPAKATPPQQKTTTAAAQAAGSGRSGE